MPRNAEEVQKIPATHFPVFPQILNIHIEIICNTGISRIRGILSPTALFLGSWRGAPSRQVCNPEMWQRICVLFQEDECFSVSSTVLTHSVLEASLNSPGLFGAFVLRISLGNSPQGYKNIKLLGGMHCAVNIYITHFRQHSEINQ